MKEIFSDSVIFRQDPVLVKKKSTMGSSLRLDQASSEELDRLETRYRDRKRWLVVASILFSSFFVLSALLMKETIVYTIMQGLFLAVGFVFVTFITESEKKIRVIRNHRRSIHL